MSISAPSRRPYAAMTLFFGADDPLSNWHPARFVYRGMPFVCVEQFMMYCKARLFDDMATAGRIMAATHPSDHKRLGREVRPFDNAVWMEKCEGYVRVGCREKFWQNPSMARALLATEGTELVEASRYDRIWGVGLGKDDPRILDRRQWRGANRLGNVLMDVRDILALELDTRPSQGSTRDACLLPG